MLNVSVKMLLPSRHVDLVCYDVMIVFLLNIVKFGYNIERFAGTSRAITYCRTPQKNGSHASKRTVTEHTLSQVQGSV